MREKTRRFLIALAWLVAAGLIALGAAGVVAGLDSSGRDGTDRSGRTARGDALVDTALDSIEADMRDLSLMIDGLGQQARVILTSLSSNDTDGAEAAIAVGTALLGDIDQQVERIRDALDVVPIIGSPAAAYELTPASTERHATYLRALDSTAGLEAAWTRLSIGSLSASRLSGLLAAHDQAVVDAAEAGRSADYATALERLDEADAAIAQARTMRDRMVATVDVTVLDEWLDRSAAYDVALRDLYVAVQRAGGEVTDAVREAIAAEERAKRRLPPDTRSLVLIMAEIGQSGINESAIAIDRARTDLDEALGPRLGSPAP